LRGPEFERRVEEAKKAATRAHYAPQTEKLPRGCLIAIGLGFALVFIGLGLAYALFGSRG
jgi:hypothetical protein